MHRTRWPDLPPELLHEISTDLHDPTNFVRFHAICKPWRSSHGPTFARKTTTDQFLPWLLAPNEEDDDSLKFRCVFSKSSYLASPPPTTGPGRNWVASADGSAAHLPRFLDGQWKEENPCGTIYDDGTVLLYTKYDSHNDDSDTVDFSAALLRPGDDEWTVIHRTLEFGAEYYGEFCVAYHDGRILVTVERNLWLAVPLTMTPSTAVVDVPVPRPPSVPLDEDGYFYEYNHVLESRGELLWASVHIRMSYPEEYRLGVHGLVGALSVLVHALEDAPAALRWVQKRGTSLADRILFLGWPNSFAVDASRLGVTGGFVYFMYDDDKGYCEPHELCGVFRYNLIDKTTEFVEWLPEGWDDEMCAWLIPQPRIAPINALGSSHYPRS
ncbi:unnamed protein product [Alopecurus aequalis]